jgi:hypothetical protein
MCSLKEINPSGRKIRHDLSVRTGMPQRTRLGASVIVLNDGDQQFAREMASPSDALRVALMMLL